MLNHRLDCELVGQFVPAAASQDRIDDYGPDRSSLDRVAHLLNDLSSREHSGFDRGDLKIIEQRRKLTTHRLGALVLYSKYLLCILKGDAGYDSNAVASKRADSLYVGQHAGAA